MVTTSKFKYSADDRIDIITNLTKMILSYNDPFVLNINGKWGSGKTTFVKLWQEYLETEHNLKSIYFSAWEDDFSEEPLISILGEVHTYLEDIKPSGKINLKFNKVKNLATKIIRKGFPSFIKGATSGFLDMDKGFESAFSSMTESAALELIEKHSENKNQILQFKELLGEIVKELHDGQPLIIFIDELDRCRPTYAIELLERIKHIFGIKQVVFILSTDKVQLSQSIKVLYGDIDTENYLRRFIDLEFNLPGVGNIERYLTLLEGQYGITQGLSDQKLVHSRFMRSRERLMEPLYYNLTLTFRQIEEIYRYQRIIYLSSHNSFLNSFVFILPILLSLKIYDSSLYKKLINYTADKDIILDVLLSNSSKFVHKEDKYIIEAVVQYTVSTDVAEEDLRKSLEKDLIKAKIDDKKRIQYLIDISKERSENISFSHTIRNAIDKIEFSDTFSFIDDDLFNSLEEK